jgi:hypothetical protein
MSTKNRPLAGLAISAASPRCRLVLKPRLAWLSALGLVACLLGMSHAFAFALYTVGDDAACSFDDLQQAIDASTDPEGNSVLVAQDLTYSDQHLVITDRNINILGGLATCDANEYIGQTTINGTSGHSVFEIEGNSHVYVANLIITGAAVDSSNSGGGIYFGGQGSLELTNTSITNNEAGYGGGIDVSPSGGPATLTLDDATVILSNTASVSGGGIRIEGDTRLYVLRPQTLIGFNHALGGYGGGLEVLGPARADIGSPGYNSGAVIQFNDAQYGGGIAAISTDSEVNAIVRLFTTDPGNPVQVADNVASATGGGVYLRPLRSLSDGLATLCAYDFRIHDNVAQEGAAIYADEDGNAAIGFEGGDVFFNTAPTACVTPEAPPALGAVACGSGVSCSDINGNVAADINGTPTAGSTILLQSAATLNGDRFSMRGNQGAHAIRALNDDDLNTAYLENCLLVDNALTAELLLTDADSGIVDITGCTFAHNQIGAPYVMLARGHFELSNSIVDEPGRATIDFAGGGPLFTDYVLSNDTTTLVAGDGIIQGEPDFVDVTSGDYHLQLDSLGVDFAPSRDGRDLDRQTRTVDLPGVPNTYGPLDLGAYEIQVDTVLSCANADTIFCNGFDP